MQILSWILGGLVAALWLLLVVTLVRELRDVLKKEERDARIKYREQGEPMVKRQWREASEDEWPRS